MAATEYFTPAARPPLDQQNSGLYPPPPVQRANSSQPGFGGYQPVQPGHLDPPFGQPSPQFGGGVRPPSPYTQSPHPPPYQPLSNDQKVHFAQNPSPPGPSQSTYALNQPNYQASRAQQLAPYPPGPYVPAGAYHQIQPYAQPHHRSHHRHSHSDPSGSGYSSDPEHSRDKHRKDRTRRISESSRSSKADGFIGAAGGGLIGDLIFPGLGTVGGALVGFFGGKDYGKHRKWREEKRDREQERWERKYRKGDSGDDSYSRSRSHSRDDRDRDVHGGTRYNHIGHDGLLHSHTRKSHDY